MNQTDEILNKLIEKGWRPPQVPTIDRSKYPKIFVDGIEAESTSGMSYKVGNGPSITVAILKQLGAVPLYESTKVTYWAKSDVDVLRRRYAEYRAHCESFRPTP